VIRHISSQSELLNNRTKVQPQIAVELGQLKTKLSIHPAKGIHFLTKLAAMRSILKAWGFGIRTHLKNQIIAPTNPKR
jgi:hypothetical protein